MKTTTRIVVTLFLVLLACPELVAQSTTTGSLRLRNSQPETISLTIPQAAVTGYSLVLPEATGLVGQAMTITSITGADAQLAWTDASFWHLDGTAVTAGGTGVGQQYLGSNNEQDLVLGANASEVVRIVGVAGLSQGFVGIGTANPQSLLDVGGSLTLSNQGSASELRFSEPSGGGTEYSAFRAGDQSASITYTLPLSAPTAAGHVLTSNPAGDMSWESPVATMPMGVFDPADGQYQFEIPVGPLLHAGSVPVVSMINPPGTVVGVTVNAIDLVNQSIQVETSVAVGSDDRIAWVIFNP